MNVDSWQIGDVAIHRVADMELGHEVMQRLIPDASSEALLQLPWLQPNFIGADGTMSGSIHTLVVRTPDRVIVVDTCVGNDKTRKNPDFHQRQSAFLEELVASGVAPEEVDTVLCTHLHIDHVGWNTVLRDGSWVPTFANARYLFGRKEFEHWQGEHGALERLDVEAVMADSVQPVLDAGQADLVDTDHQLCPEVRLLPTPGHTPGHVSVLVESQGLSALITGDFLHHPCQFAHPEWPSSPDSDPQKNHTTRLDMYRRFADSSTLVIGTHFAAPSAGHLRQSGERYRFDV